MMFAVAVRTLGNTGVYLATHTHTHTHTGP